MTETTSISDLVQQFAEQQRLNKVKPIVKDTYDTEEETELQVPKSAADIFAEQEPSGPVVLQPVTIEGGLKRGTYTENDLAENDVFFDITRKYMIDRNGIQAVENKEREEIVSDFLNIRRGVAAGNTYRGLSEFDWLSDNKRDAGVLARAGRAYSMYEGMAGVLGKETEPKELFSGLYDFTRTTVLEPLNVVGAVLGKVVGRVAAGGSPLVIQKLGQKEAFEAMSRASLAGASDEAIEKAGQEAFKQAFKLAKKQAATNINTYTNQLLSSRGFKRLVTKGALAEIGTTVAVDAVAGASMEALYQNGLIRTNVEEEYKWGLVGLAALGSLIIGGITAGRQMARGELGTKVSPLTAATVPQRRKVLQDLTDQLVQYGNSQVPKTSEWLDKVAAGRELRDLDSDFFIKLVVGFSDEGGSKVKGISQLAQENGVVWVRENDENIGNWVAEIIKASEPEDVKAFVSAFSKATGNKLNQISSAKMTPEELANTFANKMSQAGRELNALKQAADMNGVSIEDLKVEMFIANELDLSFKTMLRDMSDEEATSLIEKAGDKIKRETGISADAMVNAQNKVIRLLVSNPSTSYLNVVGWGAHTTLNTATDLSLAAVHAGQGTLQRLLLQKEAGTENIRLAGQLIRSTLFKSKAILDPSMTENAFQLALTRNSKALEELDSTLPGGVENATRLVTGADSSKFVRWADLTSEQAVDAIQAVTLVKAQDRFTKSIEFVSQMDKALRLKFDKGWDEFYSSKEAFTVMQTKEYAAMEALAVQKTQEAIFSKSYKGSGSLGQIAGFIEDARNIPGVGLMVPFGRFFNNTVDFALQSSGLGIAGKVVGRYYPDKTYKEMMAKTMVAGSFTYYLMQDETEKRKQGLGLYDTVVNGEVINQQFDYPLSAFKAAARIASYYEEGESPPKELIAQVARDFTLEGILRNLDQSQKDMATLMYHVIRGELEQAKDAAGKNLTGVGSQIVSASTRFIEPVNVIAGVAREVRGEDARPIDRYQGNKFANDALRYFDNIIPLFKGKPMGETLQQAAKGEADITSTKVMGIRPVRLTQTQRIMNMMGYDTFGINAARKIRRNAPKTANELNRILFDIVEAKSTSLMSNRAFRSMPTKDQRVIWNELLTDSKKSAREFLSLQFTGPNHTFREQEAITTKHSPDEIEKAIQSLEEQNKIGEDRKLDELNRTEILLLEQYLEIKPKLDAFRIKTQVSVPK